LKTGKRHRTIRKNCLKIKVTKEKDFHGIGKSGEGREVRKPHNKERRSINLQK